MERHSRIGVAHRDPGAGGEEVALGNCFPCDNISAERREPLPVGGGAANDRSGHAACGEGEARRVLGGRHRLERAQLPRIHDGSRFHVQRLPYHGRAGDPYRYLQTGFRRRTYRAYQRGGRSGLYRARHRQPRRARSLRRGSCHFLPRSACENLRQRSSRCERFDRPLRRPRLRAGQDGRYPAHRQANAFLHSDHDGALARQYGHVFRIRPHPVLQRRVRPAFRVVEALRRRGGPARGAGAGEEILRQHRHAVLAPCSKGAQVVRRVRGRHDRSQPRRHLAQPCGRDPGGVRAVEFARPR